ncbi:MAG: hypothetical protein GY856_12695 [bacterium]|nr:hypothetical protein [bacterium]
MRRAFEVWRRRLWLWGIPLVFCMLNLIGVACYQLAFAGKVRGLQGRFESASHDLAALRNEHLETEKFLARVETNRENIALLHSEHFSTEAERFTRVVQQVKRLAREAGLNPTSFSYPEDEIEEWDLSKREIVFQVQGTYDQLRTFINSLELTDQFLILEKVALNETGAHKSNPTLGISLTISTVFVTPEKKPPRGLSS